MLSVIRNKNTQGHGKPHNSRQSQENSHKATTLRKTRIVMPTVTQRPGKSRKVMESHAKSCKVMKNHGKSCNVTHKVTTAGYSHKAMQTG